MKRVNKIVDLRSFVFAIFIGVSALLSSCIDNDLPYPVVELSITNIEGEGFVMQNPDYATRTITLVLDETTDISNVRITDATYSDDTELSMPITGVFDLRVPMHVTLSRYQDYEWTIEAKQTIERHFKVEGQIGQEIVDVEHKIIKANVAKSVDLENVVIRDLKLGPEGITSISPSIKDITYFETFRTVEVRYHSFVEDWRLYVEHTDVVVDLNKCDVWAKVAHLSAAGDSSVDCGFKYRKEGTTEWSVVSDDQIVKSEGVFSTTVKGLECDTPYEFKAYSGSDESVVMAVRTEQTMELVNGGFEEWSQPANPWLPFSDEVKRFWDSGNVGATLLGANYNLTTPSDDTRPNSAGSRSAKLQSRKVTVKFAAGNIFVGKFVKIAGTNGIVGFGQPFTKRPLALRGWVKYNCGVVDMVGETPPGVDIVKGESFDSGSIFAALGNWTPEEYGVSANEPNMLGTQTTPIIVDTRDKSTFFNPQSDAVISYGELFFTESQSEWMQFEIPLDYRSTNEIPTHLVIVASASRYGDYFTGSTQSAMWLDDLELVYE